LGIYIPVALLTMVCLGYHAKLGFFGWFYLLAFCGLRLAGSGLQVGAEDSGTVSMTGAIIANVGLSPLTVAVMGILQEVTKLRQRDIPQILNWPPVLFFHIIVGGAVGLVAAGSSGEASSNPASDDPVLVEVGFVIFLLAWIVLIMYAVYTLLLAPSNSSLPTYAAGTKLLYAVFLALPLIGIRFIFGLVAAFTKDVNLNPVTGNIYLNIFLNILPELLATILLVIAGLMTRKSSNEVTSPKSRDSHERISLV